MPSGSEPPGQCCGKALEIVAHRPVPINQIEAKFPKEARSRGESGLCAVSVLVDTEGKPHDLRIIRCTDQVFAEPSLEAARRYLFKPATTKEGEAVPVRIREEVNFRFSDHPPDPSTLPRMMIRFALRTPSGTTSAGPDAKGVYLLTGAIDPPKLTAFSDEGYGWSAFIFEGESPCDVLLTVDRKGKPSDPVLSHCERSGQEKPAIESLLHSHFKPGSLNGTTVPVRVSVHLEFLGFFPFGK